MLDPPGMQFRLGRWKYAFIASLAVLLGLLVFAAVAVPFSSDALRSELIRAMAAHLDSEVELGRFHARVFPALHIDGGDLVIRYRARRDIPPLITVRTFSVDAGLFELLRKHITRVALTGLDVDIPPEEPAPDASAGAAPTESVDETSKEAELVIDRLETTDASLTVLPDRSGVAPKIWSIHSLAMRDVGARMRMPFRATLSNAVPPGEIATTGTFGPWNADAPGRTPVDGQFRFDNADLAFFRGIYGTLSAHGTFGGELERLDVKGRADVPDFGVTLALNAVPLHATYHSIVDAMNGNTLLEHIEASFLATSLSATGAVLARPDQTGRTVSVDADIEHGRLEDLLQLAVKARKPPMTGAIRLRTAFVLPPGDSDVIARMQLDGRFTIDGARFTSLDIQKRIDELSHRSRGRDLDQTPAPVLSDFSGVFRLRSADLDLPAFQFAVPGASVHLAGNYRLRSGRLDFHGTLLMAAKLSQTVRGFKHVLLKLVDPLFRGANGGSRIPIKITGTRESPDFGIDTRRIFRR